MAGLTGNGKCRIMTTSSGRHRRGGYHKTVSSCKGRFGRARTGERRGGVRGGGRAPGGGRGGDSARGHPPVRVPPPDARRMSAVEDLGLALLFLALAED